MATPRSTYVSSGKFEIHVTEWGDIKNPPLIMWHGLARTGRDFDEAAEALSDTYFVLCPDTLGRGLSSWADVPETDYAYDVFSDHAGSVLDHYGLRAVRWVGTSMGGLLGVHVAAGALKGRITHLVVNDIGPGIPEDAIDRIIDYVGNPPEFATMMEFEAWLRASYVPFGDNTDSFWRRLADTSARRTGKGRVAVHYDPAISVHFASHSADFTNWRAWDAVEAKTLLLRGEASDVLPGALAEEMRRRGPKPDMIEFSGFGHAPTLTSDAELSTLRTFLAG